MPSRNASLARITLLLAASLPCACAQTTAPQTTPPQPAAKPIQITTPGAKPAPTAKPITLGTTIKPAETAKPTEIVEEAPPPPEAPVKSFAPAPVFDSALDRQIRSIVAASHGKVALYAWQLNTSRAVAIDADQPIQTESVVQLAMLWETLRQIALGNINWDETITTKPAATTVRDAAVRMVAANDTAVPNLLAERFTAKRIEQDMTTFGYNGDWLARSPAKRANAPIPDRTTPRQMVRLLQHLGMCDLDLPKQLHVNINRADAACTTAVSLMRSHIYRDTMPSSPRPAQGGTGVLSKTGAVTPGPSQCAILAAKTGPIVIAIYAYDAPDSDAQAALASITGAILNAWSPSGMDSALLDKPHLGVSWE